MNAQDIVRYLQTLDGVQSHEQDGDTFFFIGPDRKTPFVTLVNDDRHDTASALHRPGVFRLNIGIGMAAYRARFGDPPPFPKDNRPADTGYDYAAQDTLLPHPTYAAMGWVCVLNPSDKTFASTVKPLLGEAHANAVTAAKQR